MDRRTIIKNILVAAVGGVALSAGTTAAAKHLGWDKYAQMVRKQKNLLSLHYAMMKKADGSRVYGSPGYREMMTPKVDELLGFAMDNFQGDTTSADAFEATRQIFKGREFCDTLDVEKLKEIMEVVIPIAVARNLLAYHRIAFDPKGATNWAEFANRYQDLILQA